MKKFSKTILMLGGIVLALAVAPMASYAQSKVEEVKNVNVINTPSVNVANIPNVNVTNTPKVRNANDLNIFQESRGTFTNDDLEVFSYLVPLGKRLVIEFASINATIGRGEKLRALIRGGNGLTDADHAIVMSFQVPVAGQDIFVGAQQMRMYAEPGTTVTILVNRRDAADTGIVSANAFIQTSISGYLVDVP
ncbi:MAG TPA: hypothetical protein VL866_23725 [Pyrinomonadaceae bacterium]|nr:hypothetical protein [Pyrinomonadaceae bacterium]